MEVGGDVLEIGTHDETTDDVLLLLYLLDGGAQFKQRPVTLMNH